MRGFKMFLQACTATVVNIALCVNAQVLQYTVEAVKTGSFPDSLHARSLLKDQRTNFRNIFTTL